MERQINTQSNSIGRFSLFAIVVALITGCANSATNTGTATSAVTTTSSTLAISPSSITLTAGTTYTFSASGGSGSGYTFSLVSGNSSLGAISTSGYYYSGSGSSGTSSVLVTDSAGNVAYASVNVTTTSTSTSTYSLTGTLTNCAGTTGGTYFVNNWQANGTQLRTIGDANYFQESPVNCSGLSIAGQIPATATITGVSVGVYLINQTSAPDGSLLESLSLINSGAVLGTLSSLNLLIPGNTGTFPTHTQGSSTNLWNASLTPAIVNSSTFGVSIQTYRTYNRLFTGNVSANMPQVTIYYTL